MTDCEINESDPYIQKMSDILENCRSYTINDLNTDFNQYINKEHGSMLFQNIDGNRTNFDAFSMELQRIALKFQVIGLAETI